MISLDVLTDRGDLLIIYAAFPLETPWSEPGSLHRNMKVFFAWFISCNDKCEQRITVLYNLLFDSLQFSKALKGKRFSHLASNKMYWHLSSGIVCYFSLFLSITLWNNWECYTCCSHIPRHKSCRKSSSHGLSALLHRQFYQWPMHYCSIKNGSRGPVRIFFLWITL